MSISEKLIQQFVDIWRVDAPAPAGFEPDIIVAASYAVKKDTLTDGSEKTLLGAIEQWKISPTATIVFANSSHCFPDSDKVEEGLKLKILREHEVPGNFVLSCGPIKNTVTEAEAIVRTLRQSKKGAKNILLISGELHSRSILYIWKRIFPEANIALFTIPHSCEYQKDHPLIFQRGPFLWVLGNLLRQASLRILGIGITGKMYDASKLS